MISIGEILTPARINLTLSSADKLGAIDEVLSKLNGDPAVNDWPALRKAVFNRNAPAIVEDGFAICIAHGRTDAVNSIVMAAGRSLVGVRCSEISEPVKLIFVAGIPAAFNSEYLRIVGAIARVCQDHGMLNKLMAAKDARKFLEVLEDGESQL